MFDPETILYRVWQQDIPPGWHVYPRWRLRAWMFGCAFALFFIVAALIFFVFAPGFWLHDTAIFIGIILVAIVGGSLCLTFGARQGLNFPLSHNPDGVLVVMPEGVVEYVSTHVPIYTLPFAEIRALSRYQSDKRAWLKVVCLEEDRVAEWTPRALFGSNAKNYAYEVIFEQIIDNFEAYTLRIGEEARGDDDERIAL